MATLSPAPPEAILALAQAYKAGQNQQAARLAALVSLYYLQRVDPASAGAVEQWLALVIPRIIAASDTSARLAAIYYGKNRAIEVPGAPSFTPTPVTGFIDDGVKKSLMAVGPGDYMNKLKVIQSTEGLSEPQQRAMIAEAKQVTATKLAAATVRHAQAGGRETILQNQAQDEVAIGWVRVTREKPCWFCAMLASRGLEYRAFKEGAFSGSNSRYVGSGDAKVHDGCGCSLKAVYTKKDPLVDRTKDFSDMWTRWGAGGNDGTSVDAALRFRRGYANWAETGTFLSWEDVAKPA